MRAHHYSLHLGTSNKVLATVIPDQTYPGMWRIQWPDGTVSDMVNLARAKDAAVVIASRDPAVKDRTRFTWRSRARQARPMSPEPAGAPREPLSPAPLSGVLIGYPPIVRVT
jgi:hypothetical protein